MAELGMPVMRLPIQYALCDPERRERIGEPLDFARLSEITFEQPDLETFRGLALAYEAAETGGSMPTVLNAANEKAVAFFLEQKISYLMMAEMIEDAMGRHKVIANPSLEEILAAEQEVYWYLEERVKRI